MRESINTLTTESSIDPNNEQTMKEQKEIILIFIKIISLCIVLLVFLFQLEFFLYFVINAFSSNNILINFF